MAVHQEGNGSSKWLGRFFTLLVIVGLLGAGVYGSTRLLAKMGEEDHSAVLTHKVSRGELLITVTEDGNLQSAVNVDIKCQVAGGSSILWIIPDGQEVKQGDKLVELNSAQLNDQINQQRIILEKARSTLVQAEKDHAVAEISVTEYLEGTLIKDLQTMQATITIAMENLRSAENGLEYSQRMFRKGYISSLELESQQFAVQRSKLEVDSAKMAKSVNERFTKAKMLQDLESKVATAHARVESEKAAFALEEATLKRLEAQRELCTIIAPQNGMAVYANDQGGDRRFGSSQSSTIEEGAAVRERQNILRLPDLSQMEVKVLVHETKVESLSRGMRARIRIQDRESQGTVTGIGNQPERTYSSGNVKEYAALVRIDGKEEGLKPGMTAEVEILVAYLKDVISLPVAAIVQQRDQFYCWVTKGDGKTERRPLILGQSNEQFVEIKDGVKVGDDVLLNPRAILPEARQDDIELEKVDVTKKFGSAAVTPQKDKDADKKSGGKTGRPNAPGDAATRGGEPGRGGEVGRGGEPGRGESGRGGDPARGGDPSRGGAKRGGPGMGNLMSLDKDGDKKVSRDEAPEQMQGFFDRLDTNGDGFIDQAEIDARPQRKGGGGGGGAGGPGGPGGAGREGGPPPG